MYQCNECHSVFDEPNTVHDVTLEHFGFPCHETYLVCPCCGGRFHEVLECSICGEYITEEYIKTDNGQTICDNCYTVHNMEDD